MNEFDELLDLVYTVPGWAYFGACEQGYAVVEMRQIPPY